MEQNTVISDEQLLHQMQEELTCPICTCTFNQAGVRRFKCGHTACTSCATEVLKRSSLPTCPLCNKRITSRSTAPDQTLTSIASVVASAVASSAANLYEGAHDAVQVTPHQSHAATATLGNDGVLDQTARVLPSGSKRVPMGESVPRKCKKSLKKRNKRRVKLQQGKIVVATSALSEMQTEVEQNVIGIGASIGDIEEEPERVTHLVVRTDSLTGRAKRTPKLLTAAAFGIPILTSDWVFDGCPTDVDLDHHVPVGDSVSGDGGPERLLTSNQKPLHDVRILVGGASAESDGYNVLRMKLLAEAAGASVEVLNQNEHAHAPAIASDMIHLGAHAGCISHRWLLDSIALQQKQPLALYSISAQK